MTAVGGLPRDGIGGELTALAANLGPALAPVQFRELLQSIADVARRMFEAAGASIALLDESTGELVFEVTVGAGADNIRGARVPMHQGIAGYVATTGQSIAITDVSTDTRFARDVAESSGYVPHTILAAPLETEETTIGVLEVIDPASDRADLELLGVFALQAALALAGSKVFGDLGRVLLRAAAEATVSASLRAALDELADSAPAPDADLAELAAVWVELGALGESERRTGTRLLRAFVDYARSQRLR